MVEMLSGCQLLREGGVLAEALEAKREPTSANEKLRGPCSLWATQSV